MHPQVPPQNTPLLWQLNSHKHISSIPELLRCCTIIVVTLNLMFVQVLKLRRKSHSLLDDPRIMSMNKLREFLSTTTSIGNISRSPKVITFGVLSGNDCICFDDFL